MKNPITASGIEPATCRLVAQCLNQLRYASPFPVLIRMLNGIHEMLLMAGDTNAVTIEEHFVAK
jgi:hypothetical protein